MSKSKDRSCLDLRMSSLLSADLAAACNALGYFDVKSNKYYADSNTLETVKDLIRYLRRDDESHDIRRQLGETKVLQTDLLPLLKSYWEETDLFDVLLRLIVNLTTPALMLWNEELPTDKYVRNFYLEIEGHLQSYKEAFADEAVWAVLSTRLSKILEIEYTLRGDENSLIIERILILVRNVLYVPADSMERRPDNDASIHDQVLWALHQSGMLDIILYVTSSSSESAYYLHILEILSFMLREQRAGDLAGAALQRSQTEKVRDEAELLAIRHRETSERQKKSKMFSGTRHSRFGGTFVVKSMKSISDNELIYHKPLSKLDALNFDADKTKPKTPKNRLPIKASQTERRSAFSIRLFLKEFCVEFLNGSYNTLMYHVKDNLVRAKAQVHDESYYLWAMRFFMEFNRCYKFEVKLVSETMSVQAFRYVQQQSEKYFDMITTDKKKLKSWSRRLHLAVVAYRELFQTLSAMDRSSDVTVRESSDVIKSNIFYVLEYREFVLTLLVTYDEIKMSDSYLMDLIETQHIFVRMLEAFVKKDGCVMVQAKGRRKQKKKQKKGRSAVASQPRELDLDGMWDEVSPQISSVLENNKDISCDVPPFDAASDIPIDDQKTEAMKNIQRKLRNGEYESGIGLLRAAREVWPENDSFGNDNMAAEEAFLALRDIFFADLGENNVTPAVNVGEDDEDQEEDDEEEEDGPVYNETNFKFEDFTKRLPHPKIVRACGLALRQFDRNTVNANHCIVKLLHRIAFDCKMPIMVFQLSIFRTFQRIFQLKDLPEHKELVKFATYIVRQFIKVSETNKKVFMEALFWKSSGECCEIENGYNMSDGKLKSDWTDEQEDELRHLFMEYQEAPKDEDIVDWITNNLVDNTRSRRQVLKKLKDLMLLVDYKGKKKSGAASRPPKVWTQDEENNLQELFELFRDSNDVLGNIMDQLEVPRPKNRVVEKLLVMGLIQDKREVYKKRSKKSTKSALEDDRSDGDSLHSDSEDDGSSQLVSKNKPIPTQKRQKKKTASSNKNRAAKRKVNAPVSKKRIAELLIKITDSEMQEALGWLKESLSDAIEDYEVGNNEGIPLVPVMDYAEAAMENADIQQMLKGIGICPPFDEQESYWRIPSHITPVQLTNYCEMIQQAIDKTLEIEEDTEILPDSEALQQDESSEDEDLFNKLRTITSNSTEEQNPREVPTEPNDVFDKLRNTDKQVSSENGELAKKKSRIQRNILDSDDESNDNNTLQNVNDDEMSVTEENTSTSFRKALESDSEEDDINNDKTSTKRDRSDSDTPRSKKKLRIQTNISDSEDESNDNAKLQSLNDDEVSTGNETTSTSFRKALTSDSEEDEDSEKRRSTKRDRGDSGSDGEDPVPKKGRIIESDED